GTAFLSSTDGVHDGSPTGGVVSGMAPSIIVGGLYEVTVFTETLGLGEAGAGVANTPGGMPVDDNQANNTSTTRTLNVIEDTDDYSRLVFLDDLADGNFGPFNESFPPGLFAQYENFDKPFVSPDGTKFIISAD